MNLPDGSVLRYEYIGERIVVKDSEDKILLQVWYDNNGNLVKRTIAKWGPIGQNITYIYDHEGKMIDIYLAYESPGGCEYDQNGRLIKKILSAGYHEYQYDENGNISQDIIYDQNGTKKESNLYYYDSNGILQKQRKSTQKEEDSCVEDTGDSVYTFDSSGNVVSVQDYNQMNDKIRIANYCVYDENGIFQEKMHQQEQFLDFIHVSGSIGSHLNSYEFIYKDGVIVPSYIYGKACGGYVAFEQFTAAHTIGDACKSQYDSNGKIVKCVHRSDISSYWTECEFDGNQRKAKETHHLEFGNIVCTYIYDSNGKLLKSTTTGLNSNTPEMVYEYDSYGRPSKYTHGNATAEFIYDQNGKTHLKYWNFTKNDNISARAEYSYDDQFNLIKTTYRGENENGYSLSEYNAKNQKIKQINYAKDHKISQLSDYTYDDKGYLVKITNHCPAGKMLSESTFTYDGAGNQTDWQFRTEDGKSASKFEYEYTDDETYATFSHFKIIDLLPAIFSPDT